MSVTNENTNAEAFLSFKTNPSLADAINDVNVGDEFSAEVKFTLISKDSKGAACQISEIVPAGYELEEPSDNDQPTTNPGSTQPPGYLGSSQPVVTAMRLKKKGSNG